MPTKLVFAAYQLSDSSVYPPRLQQVVFSIPCVGKLHKFRAKGREPGNPEGAASLSATVCGYLTRTFPELLEPFSTSRVLFVGVGVRRFAAQLAYECSLPESASHPLPLRLHYPRVEHLDIEDLWESLRWTPPEVAIPSPPDTPVEVSEDELVMRRLNHAYDVAVRYGIVSSSGCLSEV